MHICPAITLSVTELAEDLNNAVLPYDAPKLR